MSRQITQPVNQVRLTNVAVVRMNYHGKRFEVACYRNKILNYRQRIETDLSEVLQTDRVFINVSKGLIASTKDLQTAFQTTDQEEVCRIILDKGQIQVSDMERSATLESTAKEIANYISTKCVHPVSNRPYTTNQIRDAMKKAEISVQPTSARSVKQQFLDCVKVLQKKKVLEICRAKMELAFVLPRPNRQRLQAVEFLLKRDANAIVGEGSDTGAGAGAGMDSNTAGMFNDDRIHFLIDPSQYRVVDAIAKSENGAKLEILRQTVTQEGDVDVNLELERNSNLLQQQNQNSSSLDNNNAGVNANANANASTLQETGLTDQFNQLGFKNEDKGDNNYEYDAQHYESSANTRKKNKKAAKKSKKAKRREKEEASIREERIEAEKVRQEERAFRLGNTDGNGSTNNNMNASEATAMMAQDVSCSLVGDGGSGGKPTEAMSDRKSCNTCGGSFSASQYRAHFRSDWHRYNVKLKMKGIAPIDEKEFLMSDSDAFFNNAT